LKPLLDEEDILELSNSASKLSALQHMVAPVLKPVELESLGLFLQGGDISETVLKNCLEAHQ
jgi:hypothetical protein